jgi:hypothetical protein
MYTVGRYQDLNGDGIDQWPNDGGDLVFAEMRTPNEEPPGAAPCGSGAVETQTARRRSTPTAGRVASSRYANSQWVDFHAEG